jgi:hypothetical protein
LCQNTISRYHPYLPVNPFHYNWVVILALKQEEDNWLMLIFKNLREFALTSEIHKNITDNTDLEVHVAY